MSALTEVTCFEDPSVDIDDALLGPIYFKASRLVQVRRRWTPPERLGRDAAMQYIL
jgi:hypothetical protein